MLILPIVSKLSNKTQDVMLTILFKGISGNFNQLDLDIESIWDTKSYGVAKAASLLTEQRGERVS
jgi:hypothetical protein